MPLNTETNPLIEEYSTLVAESRETQGIRGPVDWDTLEENLCDWGQWNVISANELISLAKRYGAFILRNAHALAVALEIEDGDLGY